MSFSRGDAPSDSSDPRSRLFYDYRHQIVFAIHVANFVRERSDSAQDTAWTCLAAAGARGASAGSAASTVAPFLGAICLVKFLSLLMPKEPGQYVDRSSNLIELPGIAGALLAGIAGRDDEIFAWAKISNGLFGIAEQIIERKPSPIGLKLSFDDILSGMEELRAKLEASSAQSQDTKDSSVDSDFLDNGKDRGLTDDPREFVPPGRGEIATLIA